MLLTNPAVHKMGLEHEWEYLHFVQFQVSLDELNSSHQQGRKVGAATNRRAA